MKFIMLVCSDSNPDDDRTDDIDAWVAAAEEGNRRLDGGPLVSAADAVTVRVRNGRVLRDKGSLDGATESILGFDILEVADLEEAVDLARIHPMARIGRIELRALLG